MSATYRLDSTLDPRASRSSNRFSLLFSWESALQAHALGEGDSLVVGRMDPADLVLDNRSLSRLHARFEVRDGEVMVEDLGSTNGVLLNGARIKSAALRTGDLAQLGTVEVVVSGPPAPSDAERWVSHGRFVQLLRDELTRSRLFGRAASVLAVRHEEGAGAVDAVALCQSPISCVCHYAPNLLLVLLPEQTGSACELDLVRARLLNHPRTRIGCASYPVVASSAEELISQALDACHRSRAGAVVHAVAATSEEAREPGPFVRSECMIRLYELVKRIARTNLTVLIQGETGSGKELVARALHEHSTRAQAPFRALNCATIPANLIESFLFGHERGAFSGAERSAQGVFEQADGGVVFLDEIGELSLAAQAALLRVLEQRSVMRVGGTREIAVDVRVIAATHRNLIAMVGTGAFREDLLFRLDGLSLRVPPLRERRDEVVPLAELFLGQARARFDTVACRLSEATRTVLNGYAWPGNVRQLKNVIERAAAMATGERVEPHDLPDHLLASVDAEPDAVERTEPPAFDRSLPDRVREFEIGLIRAALARSQGNQAQAARMLGIPRRTLTNKVHAYGLLDFE